MSEDGSLRNPGTAGTRVTTQDSQVAAQRSKDEPVTVPSADAMTRRITHASALPVSGLPATGRTCTRRGFLPSSANRGDDLALSLPRLHGREVNGTPIPFWESLRSVFSSCSSAGRLHLALAGAADWPVWMRRVQ